VTALLIRRIDDKLKRALRLRAAENGRSMEEEMRQILRTALGVPSPEDEHERKLEKIEALAKVRYPTGDG
jgi:antitoxin FitA